MLVDKPDPDLRFLLRLLPLYPIATFLCITLCRQCHRHALLLRAPEPRHAICCGSLDFSQWAGEERWNMLVLNRSWYSDRGLWIVMLSVAMACCRRQKDQLAIWESDEFINARTREPTLSFVQENKMRVNNQGLCLLANLCASPPPHLAQAAVCSTEASPLVPLRPNCLVPHQSLRRLTGSLGRRV